MTSFIHQQRDTLSYCRTCQLCKHSSCCTPLHPSLYTHSI